MEYRKYDNTYYVRCDRGDEIIGRLLEVCEAEGIKSAVFSGIGGCSGAEIMTFDPEKGAFDVQRLDGMLELVSLNGNVVTGDGGLYHHTHALFSYQTNGEHKSSGGHLKSAVVLYTAEIELRPVTGGVIGRKPDRETGTGFWSFE